MLIKVSVYHNSSWDYLIVYDGDSNVSPAYCGDLIPPNQILSTSNEVLIHFKTDHSGSMSGFKIEYNSSSKPHTYYNFLNIELEDSFD